MIIDRHFGKVEVSDRPPEESEPTRPDDMSWEEFYNWWSGWALQRMGRMSQSMEDMRKDLDQTTLANRNLRTEVTEMKKVVESYERVIKHRQSLTVYNVGETLYVPNAGNRSVRVLSVKIYKLGVEYKVGWWEDNSWMTAELPASEVVYEVPLTMSSIHEDNKSTGEPGRTW